VELGLARIDVSPAEAAVGVELVVDDGAVGELDLHLLPGERGAGVVAELDLEPGLLLRRGRSGGGERGRRRGVLLLDVQLGRAGDDVVATEAAGGVELILDEGAVGQLDLHLAPAHRRAVVVGEDDVEPGLLLGGDLGRPANRCGRAIQVGQVQLGLARVDVVAAQPAVLVELVVDDRAVGQLDLHRPPGERHAVFVDELDLQPGPLLVGGRGSLVGGVVGPVVGGQPEARQAGVELIAPNAPLGVELALLQREVGKLQLVGQRLPGDAVLVDDLDLDPGLLGLGLRRGGRAGAPGGEAPRRAAARTLRARAAAFLGRGGLRAAAGAPAPSFWKVARCSRPVPAPPPPRSPTMTLFEPSMSFIEPPHDCAGSIMRKAALPLTKTWGAPCVAVHMF
jgi:hypothetical protein